jgi:hypothetical protein
MRSRTCNVWTDKAEGTAQHRIPMIGTEELYRNCAPTDNLAVGLIRPNK